jgi:RecA/RadA recombinase
VEFDALLPDGGLPQGVVELTAPLSLGGGTMVALAAIQAAQSKDSRAWCAWIDPQGALYAPGVVMAGVDLHRLFMVRPPQSEVGRIAVKVARSQAFAVIVVDGDPVGGAAVSEGHSRATRPRHDRSREVLVRKLALLAAEGGSTIVLLTDARRARPAPLPVALRLELERAPEAVHVRIGKDRYGRGGLAKTVPLQDRPSLHLVG